MSCRSLFGAAPAAAAAALPRLRANVQQRTASADEKPRGLPERAQGQGGFGESFTNVAALSLL